MWEVKQEEKRIFSALRSNGYPSEFLQKVKRKLDLRSTNNFKAILEQNMGMV